MNTALVYDLEIINAVPDLDGPHLEGITYCEGFHDHANMGISVIGVYDYADDRYRVFCRDNVPEFMQLCAKRAPLVSFNGIGFDDKVITADIGEMPPSERYDILAEIWAAAGLSRTFGGKSHAGFGLDAMCEANFELRKSGHGALAPIQWQRGEIGNVVDYCLNDVMLTKRLYDHVLQCRPLINPKNREWLTLRVPMAEQLA